jgi:hypothetical protein
MTKSMKILPIVVAALISVAGSAGKKQPNARPQDLSINYHWDNGSLPPPYHYGYTITVNAQGQGKFSMQASYEQKSAWQETFQVPALDLDRLYQTLSKKELFTQNWSKQLLAPGSNAQTLLVTADRHQYQVQDPLPPGQQATANQMYGAVKDLVPTKIWQKFKTKIPK